MKKTKEKILETALNLFNKRGLAQVTLRTIATEMGISQGNLNYHFKKRDDIIQALYLVLIKKMNESLTNISSDNNSLYTMRKLGAAIIENLYSYRFFLYDFTQIIRNIPYIKSHYQELSKLRQQQFLELLTKMELEGIIRPEELPNEYANYYKRMHVYGDFWLAAAEIQNKKITKQSLKKYNEIVAQSLYPYLTDKGVEEYKTVFG